MATETPSNVETRRSSRFRRFLTHLFTRDSSRSQEAPSDSSLESFRSAEVDFFVYAGHLAGKLVAEVIRTDWSDNSAYDISLYEAILQSMLSGSIKGISTQTSTFGVDEPADYKDHCNNFASCLEQFGYELSVQSKMHTLRDETGKHQFTGIRVYPICSDSDNNNSDDSESTNDYGVSTSSFKWTNILAETKRFCEFFQGVPSLSALLRACINRVVKDKDMGYGFCSPTTREQSRMISEIFFGFMEQMNGAVLVNYSPYTGHTTSTHNSVDTVTSTATYSCSKFFQDRVPSSTCKSANTRNYVNYTDSKVSMF